MSMMRWVFPAIKGVVAHYPELVQLTGSVNSALLLEQLIFWMNKGRKKDGWIYKDSRQLQAETGLSKEQQMTARRRLRDLGFIEEKKAGIPPTVHFRVNVAALRKAWDENAESIIGKRQLKGGKKPLVEGGISSVQMKAKPTYISETTSEITQENTQKSGDDSLSSYRSSEDSTPSKTGINSTGWQSIGAVLRNKRSRSV